MTDFPINAEADADLSDLISAFSAATAALTSFSTVAATATTAGVALAATALVPAVHAAGEFQKEIIRLNTLVGISTDLMDEFKDSILQLAPAIGSSPTDLARAMYAITSGGERSEKAIDLLTQSAKAARIGLGDVAVIARVGTAALQAFAEQGLDAQRAIDVMVSTVREGNLVAEELPNAFGRVIGIAAQMGITFEEVGTFIATFTRLGVSAEVAATSLRSALFALLNPGQEAKKTLHELGLSAEGVRKTIADQGLTAAMLQLLQATGGNLEALGSIIPNIRAMAGVLGVYARQADQVVEIQNNMNNAVGLTDEGFKTVQTTFENTTARFKAEVSTLATSIGTYFLPAATLLIEHINTVISIVEHAGSGIANFASDVGSYAGDITKNILGIHEATVSVEQAIAGLDEVLQSRTSAQLERTLELIKKRQDELGQRQKEGDSSPDILERQQYLLGIEQKINDILKDREQHRGIEIEGIRVLVGATDDQKKATDRLVQSLEERLLREQDNERQIIINKLAENDATEAEKAHALAIYDQMRAVKAAKELEKELNKQRQENEKELRQIEERNRRQFAQAESRAYFALEEEKSRFAAIGAQITVEKIADELDRQQRLVEAASQATIDQLDQVIRKTASVGEAFHNMVEKILLEYARLKLEKSLESLFSSILIPIPKEPTAIPEPQITINPVELPSISSGFTLPPPGSLGGPSQTVIVDQTISFSISAIDGRDMQKALREQGGTIAQIVGEAARNSVGYQKQLIGR